MVMDRSLARHARGARRWLPVAIGSIAAGTLAGWLIWRLTHTPRSLCEREVESGDRRHAIELCLASYEQTGNARDLDGAARAHMYLGELAEAEALAHQLLAGPRYGDACRILSYATLRRGQGITARLQATFALVADTLTGDQRGLASDVVLLSQAAWQSGDFTSSLDAADLAVGFAQRLRDPHKEVTAYTARADVLRRMGDLHGATEALTSAIERASEPCDKAWTHLKIGLCRIEAGEPGLAMLELQQAATANGRCGNRDLSGAVAINLAWLLRWKDPARALATLDELAKSDREDGTTLLMRGYLAADRGDLTAAERYVAQAAGLNPPDPDWPWELAGARAELAELRGGLLGDVLAEYYFRRAVALIAALRASARARSAYLVASHRAPYDELIALLARHGRWRDVLATVLELDASDMLRATADEPIVRTSPDPGGDTPAASSTGAPSFTVDDVVSAWRSRDLVIVIAPARRQIGAGRERAYRVQIAEGHVTGEDIGDAAMARRWADDLFAEPGNRDAARALGRMIVPSSPSDRTLHVLAIGPLGKVPLAALRDPDGSLVIARRPLVRVLAPGATGPEAQGFGPSVVIADPQGNLPRAAVEGYVVAEALGAGTLLSGAATSTPATRARLWAAHGASSLHVAGHVGVLGRWRALHLADGDVDPAEMVQRHLAPRVAVLAGCGSAAATDEEGWGSIAAALLESGTAVVIATDRSVRDDASLSVMRDFYAQSDWRTDPARAMARVQLALDARGATTGDEAVKPRSWAAF